MCTGLTPEGVQDAAKKAVKGRVIGAAPDRMANQNTMIEQIMGKPKKKKKQ